MAKIASPIMKGDDSMSFILKFIRTAYKLLVYVGALFGAFCAFCLWVDGDSKKEDVDAE